MKISGSRMKEMFVLAIVLVVALLMTGCGERQSLLVDSQEQSEYLLPYPVGTTYTCIQGWNCSISHKGVFLYAVDFDFPIGAVITASRAGRVVYSIDTYPDRFTQFGMENLVIVQHSDSSFGRYVHLTTNGSKVRLGQHVEPGDTIGLSGTSGASYIPHLHFDVTKECSGPDCQTVPVLFKNTKSHPFGPEKGQTYTSGSR